MSGGGAGKVYFILYLAVILELLIIIVDRDDAEEGLRKQTQEIQLIVQRILASLQTSGTQISTTPRDEIVIDPTAQNKKNEERTYRVTVNVGDPSSVRGTSGFAINKLMYTLSYDRDTSVAAKLDSGNFPSIMPVLFQGATRSEPVNIVNDSIAYPVSKDTVRKRQTFDVHFKPDQPGVYRLRFNTNVNQIIGVDLDPNNARNITDPERLGQTVRIGNVPLTVKQLLAVYKTLESPIRVSTKKQKTNEGKVMDDETQRLKLKDFIGKLLFGGSSTLESNNGEIKFEVFVRRIELPPSAQLDVSPQVRRFTAFAGVPIPNLIKANVRQLKFDQPQYGEFYQTADSTWYWRWTPSIADAGKSFNLTYHARADRKAGEKLDNAIDTFHVTVQKLQPADNGYFTPKFYSISNIVPAGDTIKVNRHYKDLEGLYRYEIRVGGKMIKEVTGEDLVLALPDNMLGSVAEIVTSFKTKEMPYFVRTDSIKLPVGPRALLPRVPNSTVIAGQPLVLEVYMGINPPLTLPAGTVLTIIDDQGGKFFNREITMTGSPSVTVPMNPGVNVSNSTPITIKIKSNIPNQIDDDEVITINPRPRRGR
jgi:hypothetical protein